MPAGQQRTSENHLRLLGEPQSPFPSHRPPLPSTALRSLLHDLYSLPTCHCLGEQQQFDQAEVAECLITELRPLRRGWKGIAVLICETPTFSPLDSPFYPEAKEWMFVNGRLDDD